MWVRKLCPLKARFLHASTRTLHVIGRRSTSYRAGLVPSRNKADILGHRHFNSAASSLSTMPVSREGVIEDIQKPLEDNRKYRYFELENGIRVFAVSDEKADKNVH